MRVGFLRGMVFGAVTVSLLRCSRSLVLRRSVAAGRRLRFARRFCRAGGGGEGEYDSGEAAFIDPFAAGESMEDRILQAELEAAGGRMQMPAFLEEDAVEAEEGSPEEAEAAGFKVVVDKDCCPGCGARFQSSNDAAPGFLPAEKLAERARMLEEGEGEGEVAAGSADAADPGPALDADGETLSRPPPRAREAKEMVCARCFKLRNYGKVDSSLRAGWSSNAMLTPAAFVETLSFLRETRGVVVYLTDIFDFHGSVLSDLSRLVGDNDVIVAANKADLLPKDAKFERVRLWIAEEMRAMGLRRLAAGDVHLMSCFSGYGVQSVLRSAREMAARRRCDVYVVGAANVGKSTFINRLVQLSQKAEKKEERRGKRSRRGTSVSKLRAGAVTASNLPGTTLGLVRLQLDGATALFDTPGVMLSHQITSRLTQEELKAVVPQSRVDHVTLRLAPGKSLMLGGLARIDVLDGMPFFFTAFVSNDVKVHPTDTSKVEDLLRNRVGDIISPPESPERYEQLAPFGSHVVEVRGEGWKRAARDVVLGGLGWVCLTGAGAVKLRITVPKGVRVGLRDPLMPFEAMSTTARYTGTRSRKAGGKGVKRGGRRT